MRSKIAFAGSVVAMSLFATTALAAWLATSSDAAAFSRAASMPAGNTPEATASGSDVTVSWAQSTFAGGDPVAGYLVKRFDASGALHAIESDCSGTVTALSCTEGSVPVGTWKYTVTPMQGSWRGAESSYSPSIEVLEPEGPSLSFPHLVTSLPATHIASISNFSEGETLTFAVDGVTVVSTPSAVPAGGAGEFSVDLPLGLSEGSHTITVTAASGEETASDTFVVDTQGPSVTIASPSDGSNLSSLAYADACATSGVGDICGTANDAGTGVQSVAVSIRRDGLYFDGSAFTSTDPVLLPASGTTSWTRLFSVPADGTYVVSALATDDTGHTGSATSTFTYDTVAPSAPTGLTVAPASPSNDITPTVSGATTPNTRVQLYTNGTCTSAIGSLTSTSTTSFAIDATVTANATSTFWATARDAAGNESPCSTSSVTYTHDDIANVPTVTGVSPSSPSTTDSTPTISGTADPGATVKMYSDSTCTTLASGTNSGSATAAGAFSISPTVPADVTTTFWATGMDAAGNVSACSSTSVTYRFDTKAPAGTDVQTVPKTPSNTVNRPENGDKIVLTYSEAMKPASIMSGWDGSETDIRVRFTNNSNNDVITFTTNTDNSPVALNLGSIATQANYVPSAGVIMNAKMTLNTDGNTVSIVLGTTISGTFNSLNANSPQKMDWTPLSQARDLADRQCSTTTVTESGGNDGDF